ncbi:hypothetical protein ACYF6T_42060 [Streptomyces sp. 7R007]
MRFGLRVVVNSRSHWGQVRCVGRCERAFSPQVGEQYLRRLNGAIIQTGTESYRLAHTKALAEQTAAG